MKTFHPEWLSGHTAAILQEIHATIWDGMGCFQEPKIAANCPISTCGRALWKHPIMKRRLATLLLFILRYLRCPMVCDASRSSKLEENAPFHRNVWQSLKGEGVVYKGWNSQLATSKGLLEMLNIPTLS